MNYEYLFNHLSIQTGIPIFEYRWAKDEFLSYHGYEEKNVFSGDKLLLQTLLTKMRLQQEPLLYLEENKICFGSAMISGESCVLLGPVSRSSLSKVELHQFYKSHKLQAEFETNLPVIHMSRMIALLNIIMHLITGKCVTEQELLLANAENLEEEHSSSEALVRFDLRKLESEAYHHSYLEEVKWLQSVEEGNVAEAKKRYTSILPTAGILSDKALNNSRYLAICGVALVTRAAIRGGVSPVEAYSLSDIFIDRIDKCQGVLALQELNRASTVDFAAMVNKRQQDKESLSCIEQCKDYIRNHYQEKLKLEDMADMIGMNPTYLSHLFMKEEGITMKTYLCKVRVERAENLLKYADTSLTEIGSYIGFHSQSHFGSVFKRLTGKTPWQYRQKFKKF